VVEIANIGEWNAKRDAIRDYLASARVDQFTRAEVVITNGRSAAGLYPRLATLIEPLPPDETGELPSDTEILIMGVPDTPESIYCIRLDGIASLDLDQ
jgi:hypothetical protein